MGRRNRIVRLERVLGSAFRIALGDGGWEQTRDRSKIAVWIPPENDIYSDLLSSILNTEVILIV